MFALRFAPIVLVMAVVVCFGGCSTRQHSAAGRGDLDKRIMAQRAAIAIQPKNDELRFQLSQSLAARGDMQGFFHEINRAISLAPHKSRYHWVAAENYKEQGDTKQALNHARIAARLGVNDATDMVPRYNKLVADLLKDMGQYREAERAYEKSLAQLSAYAREITLSYKGSGAEWVRFERDVKHDLSLIRKSLDKERPTQAWIQKDMPWFRFGLDNDSKSLAYARANIVKTAPRVRSGELMGASVHSLLASSYLAVADAQNAVIESLAAIELSPKNGIDWQTLAAAYVRQNRLDDAANAFQRSCDLGEKDSCTLSQKMLESMRRFEKYRKTSK